MNATLEQEIHYRLLKILKAEPGIGQRVMAARMGISLGKVNFCVSELAAKGWKKINRLKSSNKKKAYAYTLTPRGLEEKSRLTLRFLKRKLAEYDEIQEQIKALYQEAEQERHENSLTELMATLKAEL